MKSFGKSSFALLAALALVLSSSSSVWAARIDVTIDDHVSLKSVWAEDIPEGLTIYAGWALYPNDVQKDIEEETDDAFFDYVFKDYGGVKGFEDAEDRAYERIDEEIGEDFSNDAYYKILLEETFEKMGNQTIWIPPRNYYLLDENHEEYIYEGEGMTIVTPVKDFEDEVEYFDKYVGEYEILMLHQKHDGSFEYLPTESYKVDGDDRYYVEFTTTSLSPFAVVLRATGEAGEAEQNEVEPTKTLDDSQILIGVAGVGAAGLFALGAWFARKERR